MEGGPGHLFSGVGSATGSIAALLADPLTFVSSVELELDPQIAHAILVQIWTRHAIMSGSDPGDSEELPLYSLVP